MPSSDLWSDELRHELEALVEAMQNVQHECMVGDGLAKISKGISHTLHLAAVIVDGEGALGKGAELVSSSMAWDSRLFRNCCSILSQAARAVMLSCSWMMSRRSVEMVLKS